LEERISKLSLDKGTSSREGHESLPKEREYLMYGKKKKKGE
jgi:hypothetical protein